VYAVFRQAGYPEPVAHTLTALTTTRTPVPILRDAPDATRAALLRRPHLPQGAPTSPGAGQPLRVPAGPAADRAILHDAGRHGLAAANRDGHADFAAHLAGRVAWMAHHHPARAAKLHRLLRTAVAGPPVDTMIERGRWPAGSGGED
jgi:hypothetical protein